MMMQKMMRSATRNSYPTWQITKTNLQFIKAIFILHLLWYILGVMGFEYLPIIVSMDIGLLFLAVLHLLFFIPLAKKSVIPAYFRESYGASYLQKLYFLRDFLVIGAIFRLGGYLLLTSLIQGATSATPEEIEMVWDEKLSNQSGFILALTLYVIYLFILYYKERFMKIGEFYSEVVEDMYQRKVSTKVAMEHVRNRRKKDIAKENYSNSIKSNADTRHATREPVSVAGHNPYSQPTSMPATRKKARKPSERKESTLPKDSFEEKTNASNSMKNNTKLCKKKSLKAKKNVIKKIEKNRKMNNDEREELSGQTLEEISLPKRRKSRK